MRLLLLLLIGGLLNAQTVTLGSSAPTPVSSLSASRVGISGSTTYCYHVIAVFPIGRTADVATCIANGADTLTASNWNRVAWGSLPGALGYFLIRNSTPDTIGSCISCLLLNNVLTTVFNDTGSVIPSNYTAISPTSPVSVTISLDNQNFPNPEIMFPLYTMNVQCLQFPDATQLCSASPAASGTVTHTLGPLTSGQLIIGNGLGDVKVGDLSGDVSTSGGTNTTLGTGVVGLTNLSGSLFSGTGTQFCTVSGTLGSTHIVRFDASGNCIQSSATIDNSGNYVSPGGTTTGSGGTVSGSTFFGVQASGPSLPNAVGFAGIGVGTGAIAASYGLLMPTTGPSVANSVMTCPALSAGFSQCTFTAVTPATNAVVNNGVNTATTAMTLDMSPSTVANAFRVAVIAGATATLNGALAYDSTNNNLHSGHSAADSILPVTTVTPVNGNCPTWVVAGGSFKLGDAGFPCGSGTGSGTVSSATIAQVAFYTGATTVGGNASLTWDNTTGLAIARPLTMTSVISNESIVFASLPTPSNGMQLYCSDCKVTSSVDNTCANTGTGAMAFRVNGAWKCLQ